jgi:hypothetical protein
MKIGELARRQTGLSAHTIRYYERIGLLPYADRDRSRQRDYDASILTWIEFPRPAEDDRHADPRDAALCGLAGARRRHGGRPSSTCWNGTARRFALACRRTLQPCLLVLDTKIAGYAGDIEKRIEECQ